MTPRGGERFGRQGAARLGHVSTNQGRHDDLHAPAAQRAVLFTFTLRASTETIRTCETLNGSTTVAQLSSTTLVAQTEQSVGLCVCLCVGVFVPGQLAAWCSG